MTTSYRLNDLIKRLEGYGQNYTIEEIVEELKEIKAHNDKCDKEAELCVEAFYREFGKEKVNRIMQPINKEIWFKK